MKSLKGCQRWVDEQKLTIKEFPGVTHMGMVTGETVTDYVAKIVNDLNQGSVD